MPYQWTHQESQDQAKVELWAHNALSETDLATVVLMCFAVAILPLFIFLGTNIYWGLLPFIVGSVAALWYSLRRNQSDRNIRETLNINPTAVELTHQPARGSALHWSCNKHWVKVQLYPQNGRIEEYLTLRGGGREVELGRFLTAQERKRLYHELRSAFA